MNAHILNIPHEILIEIFKEHKFFHLINKFFFQQFDQYKRFYFSSIQPKKFPKLDDAVLETLIFVTALDLYAK
jgi:hypothetical protein